MEWQSLISDDQLGSVTFEESMCWYTAKVITLFGSVKVSLACDDFDNENDLLRELKSFCLNLNSILGKAIDSFVEELLPIKNEDWLSSSDIPITEEAFLKRVKESKISISMSQGGLAEIFFDGHNLFTDHSMVIWHNEDGTVNGPHIAG